MTPEQEEAIINELRESTLEFVQKLPQFSEQSEADQVMRDGVRIWNTTLRIWRRSGESRTYLSTALAAALHFNEEYWKRVRDHESRQ